MSFMGLLTVENMPKVSWERFGSGVGSGFLSNSFCLGISPKVIGLIIRDKELK